MKQLLSCFAAAVLAACATGAHQTTSGIDKRYCAVLDVERDYANLNRLWLREKHLQIGTPPDVMLQNRAGDLATEIDYHLARQSRTGEIEASDRKGIYRALAKKYGKSTTLAKRGAFD